MKIELIGELKTIQSNKDSLHNYFAWPSVALLQNGRIAVASSGFRIKHICPFGKAVISYSDNNGESFSRPAPVIDTPLDDRDAGLLAFGEKNLMLTSFNNTVEFQREYADKGGYADSYLNTITPENELKYHGSQFCFSEDYGQTFGEIYHSPVTSPHGAGELSDGTILWIGRTFNSAEFQNQDHIMAYRIFPDGKTAYVGEIDDIYEDGVKLLSCEPDFVELPDKTLLCHIRVQNSDSSIFTTYQAVSNDGGKTWSKPVRILDLKGGAPSQLMVHSSGTIIASYGYRNPPYGVRLMFSSDNGKTWDTDNTLFDKGPSGDLGYPSTIELGDKTLLTVFYSHYPKESDPAIILMQKWKF